MSGYVAAIAIPNAGSFRAPLRNSLMNCITRRGHFDEEPSSSA